MRTVLITGASGFIGRRTVRACLARNWRVIGLDRHPSAFEADAYTHLVHAVTPDVPLPVTLAGQTVDAAILLAWPVDPARYLHSPDNLGALAATIAIARAVLDSGCPVLVGVGTCAEYALADQGVRLREDHALRPETLYAVCKTAAHQVLEQLGRPSRATITWARIFNPFGPGEPSARLLPSIARTLAAGEDFMAASGRQVRDYIYVDDVASALAVCVEGGTPWSDQHLLRSSRSACRRDADVCRGVWPRGANPARCEARSRLGSSVDRGRSRATVGCWLVAS